MRLVEEIHAPHTQRVHNSCSPRRNMFKEMKNKQAFRTLDYIKTISWRGKRLNKIAFLFNLCLDDSILERKNAVIILIRIKEDVINLENYRPINLLSVKHLYKLFAKIVAKWLQNKPFKLLSVQKTGNI